MQSLAYSPDGSLLAAACGGEDADEWQIKVWEAESGKERYTLADQFDNVWSVAFSPDGRLLAVP